MGAAAHDAYDTLKGAVNTAQTIKSLAPRDLPKKVAKSTVLHIGHARQSNDLYPKIKNLGDNILLLPTSKNHHSADLFTAYILIIFINILFLLSVTFAGRIGTQM